MGTPACCTASRITPREKSQLVQGEQIKTLFHSAQLLYRVVLVGGLLLLLTVIYGAIGRSGFNAVTHAAAQSVQAD